MDATTLSAQTMVRLRRQPPMSRFTKTVLALVVADVLFLLFLTFGAAFPKRLLLPDPGDAQPDEFYDFTAKTSPVGSPKKDAPKRARAAAATMPVISARAVTTASVAFDTVQPN